MKEHTIKVKAEGQRKSREDKGVRKIFFLSWEQQSRNAEQKEKRREWR